MEQFSYLGNVIDADADVKTRIAKARQAYMLLKPVCSSKTISLQLKRKVSASLRLGKPENNLGNS